MKKYIRTHLIIFGNVFILMAESFHIEEVSRESFVVYL